MIGEWIRKPLEEQCVIFVHGILSSGESCWRHSNGTYWPELLRCEPELNSLGIYVFSYETSVFSGSYRLSDIVDALKEFMRIVYPKTDILYLFATVWVVWSFVNSWSSKQLI